MSELTSDSVDPCSGQSLRINTFPSRKKNSAGTLAWHWLHKPTLRGMRVAFQFYGTLTGRSIYFEVLLVGDAKTLTNFLRWSPAEYTTV
jgi:hypothetical protein